ncbi:MAG TPA: RDD family protein [Pyrinomonadaceae bacterium]|nr:RDD family protein [Pyrinomonadaceae bacterium]
MRCPSCSAPLESGEEKCPDCEQPSSGAAPNEPETSKLIEFPGVNRSTVPQWRQQLSERVREVQEKRAREAILETADASNNGNGSSPQLELLPQAEIPPVNPLVSAALKRIERAHQQSAETLNDPVQVPSFAAVACIGDNQFSEMPRSSVESNVMTAEPEELEAVPADAPAPVERVHNLVVVPPPVREESAIRNVSRSIQPKPRRMISDNPNDPALNYLDSVRTTHRVEVTKYRHASAGFRFLAAIVDLLVIVLLCSPFAAVVELSDTGWQNVRVLSVAIAVFSVVTFLYLTISTALTGRTLGTRLFSLRIVDARTGLIPTGKQSAGRALVYLVSLLTLGLASLYALVDPDKRTAHDRLTRTAVIAV